jgi:repressor of nif and glnA expression
MENFIFDISFNPNFNTNNYEHNVSYSSKKLLDTMNKIMKTTYKMTKLY